MNNVKTKVWLNGEIIPWESAQVPILSHGFSRGSAVFEVFGTHENKGTTLAFRMDAHLERLERTLALLGMELKYSFDEIREAISHIASLNKLKRGIIKIMAFWGEEAVINLVLKSKLDVAIFVIPSSDELGLDRAEPMTACISKWRKLHPETIPVQAKACANYLNGYMVRKDANDRGFDIGLNLGTDGFVAEGSIESLFLVKDGVLKTPPLGRILASITRDSVIRVAKENGIEVEETNLLKEDLYSADEMFTTHTGIKVTPIKKFENNELKAPGLITTQMKNMMDEVLNFKDTRFSEWFQKLY